jgi:hypothetical protein
VTCQLRHHEACRQTRDQGRPLPVLCWRANGKEKGLSVYPRHREGATTSYVPIRTIRKDGIRRNPTKLTNESVLVSFYLNGSICMLRSLTIHDPRGSVCYERALNKGWERGSRKKNALCRRRDGLADLGSIGLLHALRSIAFLLPEPLSAPTYRSIKLQRARHNLRLEAPPRRPCTRTIVRDTSLIIPVTLTTVRRG